MSDQFHVKLMKKVQGTLCIADGEDQTINDQIIAFSRKCAKVLVQMWVSEPSLTLEAEQFGK